MRVDDEVRRDTGSGERHIFLRSDKTADSFLTVTGCELVADLGDTEVTRSDFDEAGGVFRLGDDDGVNDTSLVTSHSDRGVAAFFNGDELSGRFLKETRRGGLADENILFIYDGLGIDDPVDIKVCVGTDSVRTLDILVRELDPVDLSSGISAFLSFIGSEEVGAACSALDRGFVEDERIFNIVSFVGDDGHTEVLTLRAVVGTDKLGCLRVHHRDLGVVKHMTAGIGPQLHVCLGKP